MNQTGQEGPVVNTTVSASNLTPSWVDDPSNPVADKRQVIDGLLEQCQVELIFESRRMACYKEDGPLVPGRTHRRSLARIQRAELNSGFVGCDRHRAAQRVDFLDQMSLPIP
jgi:hypothetical protein